MLKFRVFDDGEPASDWPLRNPHVIGSDGSAMRAEFGFADGAVTVDKREHGPAAFALQQDVGDCGDVTLQTCLLPERDEPYLLSLELARHRMMMLYNKLEDWGLMDIDRDHPVTKRVELAKRLFIESLCHAEAEPARSDKLARDCLAIAVDGSEELALAHAELLINRRKAGGTLPRHPVGCGVAPDLINDRIRAGLANNFDFLSLPLPWRDLAVEENNYRWDKTDSWVEWATKQRLPIVGGPVVSFEPSQLPDWIYIWEHDFETVRDVVYEHIETVVSRYRNRIVAWNVVSGLHINSHFVFSFDQLIDLTRMAVMLVKKIQPHARALVEVREPFGEYYGRNQRAIPPMMYADLLIQGGIQFDGFAIKMYMGQAQSGQYARDLMQFSNMLDQFSNWGKPVHLTIATPSEPVTDMMIAVEDDKETIDADCGHWRQGWSTKWQSRWLMAMYHIALSKPFIDSVSWGSVIDHPKVDLPLSGLIREDLQPKLAYKRLLAFRRSLASPDPIQITSVAPRGDTEDEADAEQDAAEQSA